MCPQNLLVRDMPFMDKSFVDKAYRINDKNRYFWRIMRWEQLWIFQSYLDSPPETKGVAHERKAG